MTRIRDVVMRLPSGGRPLTILDGVTLDVAPGEVCAITGPSGSGKSTLLGLIAGLDRPSAGSITVAGVEITGLDEDALARFRRDTLGYVFQDVVKSLWFRVAAGALLVVMGLHMAGLLRINALYRDTRFQARRSTQTTVPMARTGLSSAIRAYCGPDITTITPASTSGATTVATLNLACAASSLPWSQVSERASSAGSPMTCSDNRAATYSAVVLSILTNMPIRVERSTRVATALWLPAPMMRSPSQ